MSDDDSDEHMAFRGVSPTAALSASAAKLSYHTRKLHFNSGHSQHFCGNSISTGKYNILSFIPFFLFEQFRKAFNIFFLLIASLQQIPDVSPTGRYTTLLPLLFILSVAAIKEIIEDYKRHRQDDAINNQKVKVFRKNNFISVKWTQVVVGDIVKVVSGSFFPADLVILSSSEPQAMCYIETANLDGETNLKIRKGLPATSDIQSSEDLESVSGCIVCEVPNRHLYEFVGNITLGKSNRAVPLGPDQLLLRGAMLRNTRWIYGVVVYTGHESKLMKNAKSTPLKMSNVDRTTNMQIWFLMVILIVISLVSAIGSMIWKKESTGRWYLKYIITGGVEGFFWEFLTFMILYNNLVPISLLVTLELVKFIQAIFINCDLDMYYEENNTPAIARTSNLNEELGQVKYIFSDKTGTLTQNRMEFKKCTVAGVTYEHDLGDEKSFHCAAFLDKLTNSTRSSKPVRDFVIMMAVCHTVVPEHVKKDDPSSSGVAIEDSIEYQSSSPDENAIVKAARGLGYIFKDRTPTHVTISELGKDQSYEVLNVLEFTSTRKRMSVIVRCPDGSIMIMCKGADNVIFPRLADDSLYTRETESHLRDFAKDGLRTLCFAYSYIERRVYEKWNETVFYEASTAVMDREQKLEAAYQQVEKNLFLIGASAIEDKLQDGVPEAISTLAKADIKIWVLTGDKQETAVNIGYSCHLLTQSMGLITLNEDSFQDVQKKIKEAINEIGSEFIRQENDYGLIVSGSTLKHALHADMRSSFLDLALSCKAVVCCRVSPLQKAEIVELIKTNCDAITLAIGDGANDVSMIQAAHVGVGISGCEGLQAANSSDYSIAQFAYLEKLLLVHGAWNYNRLAKCILYSFYKNICLYLIELWFVFFNGFSGQILFDRWTITFYNLVFTSLPPFTLGIFERTCNTTHMLKHPQLYTLSQCAVKYNARVFWKMFLNATIHSIVLFFIPALAFNHDIAFANGKTGGYLFLGNFVYTYVVITVCLKAGLESNTWTIFTHFAVWGSILVWFGFLGVYSHIYPTLPFGEDMVGQADNVLMCPLFWFGVPLLPVIALSRDFIWKIYRRRFQKTVVEEVQELELQHLDPSETIIVAAHRQLSMTTPDRAHLLTNMMGNQVSDSGQTHDFFDEFQSTDFTLHNPSHGYAFSQEESGIVSQAELIRKYDTTTED